MWFEGQVRYYGTHTYSSLQVPLDSLDNKCLTITARGPDCRTAMSDSSGGNHSILLDRLKKEARVDTNSADDYSIRAWITSAKKCLDQVAFILLLEDLIKV